MKSRVLTMPLVLLCATLMWSCQGQESPSLTPLGPERPGVATKPGGGKGGGGKVEATFDVTVSIGSDVIGGAPIKNKVTNGSKSIGGFFDMPLDLSFVGKSCFTDPVTGSSTFIGAMIISQPQKKAPEQGYVQFFFTAFGNDGTPGIKYMLEMFGIFGDPANWLPAPGTATILTVADWNMTTEGKGQNRKISCIGPGTFATETTVRIFRRP